MSLVFLLIGAAGVTRARESAGPERLSLDQAVRYALETHPAIERGRHQARAAEQALRESRSSYWPQVAVDGIAKDGLSGATGDLGLTGLPGSPYFDNFAASVNVKYDIYDFGRTGNRESAARFTASSLASREKANETWVVWQVKTAYFRCLQLDALLGVARETLEERKLAARAARVYVEVELRSGLDLSLAEVNLNAAEAAVTAAENARRVGYAALELAMGAPERGPYELDAVTELPEAVPELPTLVEEAMSSRPDLLAIGVSSTSAPSRSSPRVSGETRLSESLNSTLCSHIDGARSDAKVSSFTGILLRRRDLMVRTAMPPPP